MRILAIGDVHGYPTALDAVLAAVAPTDADWIVCVGDYVDRGPDSRGVIERLLTLQKKGRLVALRGNHEEMMMASRDESSMLPMWLMNGGEQTLQSYAPPGRLATFDEIPRSHWNFLDHVCVDYFETERHLFVHADALPQLPLAAQPPQVLRWQKLQPHPAHASGKTMICGHTVQGSGLPLDLGFAVCIDTGIYLPDGKLTCLDVESGEYWQATADGTVTTGMLKPKEDADGSSPSPIGRGPG